VSGFAVGTGTLTPVTGTSYSLGFPPTAVAVNPADSILFVGSNTAIYAFAINSSTGALSVLNGGGAAMDFGCYGANLVTWLLDGRRPLSVFAVEQRLQPDVYPNVADEATIVRTYPKTQAILQASWNWPYGRKDMEIYGQTGALIVPSRDTLFLRRSDSQESPLAVPVLPDTFSNPLSYLAAVVGGRIKPYGLASLETNLVVCEILDAARESARTGRRIDLPAEATP